MDDESTHSIGGITTRLKPLYNECDVIVDFRNRSRRSNKIEVRSAKARTYAYGQ